jgi:ketosteroid isomerase-like protein
MRVPTVLVYCIALTACATTTPPVQSGTSTGEVTKSVPAQLGLTGSGDPQVQQLLGQLEDQASSAALKCDTAAIGRTVAPEYFAVNNDHIGDRGEALSCFAQGDPRFVPMSNTDSARAVRVYGDAAVITAITDFAFRDKQTGETAHNLTRYTEFWVKRNGQWQLVGGAYQDAQQPRAFLTQQLLQAEESYAAMVNQKDSTAFNRLVIDSLVFDAGTDQISTKSQLWSAISNADFRMTQHVVRTFVRGDAAVVNGTIERAMRDGSTVHLRYSDTWLFRSGKWRLVSRQLAGPVSQPTR